MVKTEFYDRILHGLETEEDVAYFNALCQDYSDMYKDIYGFRPRDEQSMCVNAYSGSPDINKYRELLKKGINPLEDLNRAYDSYDEPDYSDSCEEDDFYGKPMSEKSQEEILSDHPEYSEYFV